MSNITCREILNDEEKVTCFKIRRQVFVDEQTGRIMEGRRYSDGLHQAIEAKENVKVEAATQTWATITLQNYFRMYNNNRLHQRLVRRTPAAVHFVRS